MQALIGMEYLQPKDGPVVEGLEPFEHVYGETHPGYNPLRGLSSAHEHAMVMSRFSLTKDQRKVIAEGGDIFLSLLTFGDPLQPILIGVAKGLDPYDVAENFGIQIEKAPLPGEQVSHSTSGDGK